MALSSTLVKPLPSRLAMSSKVTKCAMVTPLIATGYSTIVPLKQSHPFIPNVSTWTSCQPTTETWLSSGDFSQRLSTHHIVRCVPIGLCSYIINNFVEQCFALSHFCRDKAKRLKVKAKQKIVQNSLLGSPIFNLLFSVL
jgi:hypothetical protein